MVALLSMDLSGRHSLIDCIVLLWLTVRATFAVALAAFLFSFLVGGTEGSDTEGLASPMSFLSSLMPMPDEAAMISS